MRPHNLPSSGLSLRENGDGDGAVMSVAPLVATQMMTDEETERKSRMKQEM